MCRNAFYVDPPPPIQCEGTSAELTPRIFSRWLQLLARSSACGEEILPCKILISPSAGTTPRFIFAVKPKQNCAELLLSIMPWWWRLRARTPRPVFAGAFDRPCAELSPVRVYSVLFRAFTSWCAACELSSRAGLKRIVVVRLLLDVRLAWGCHPGHGHWPLL